MISPQSDPARHLAQSWRPKDAGYYVTLELLALVWGTMHHNDMVLPSLADAKTVTVERRSHDFARRWMGGNKNDISDDERELVTGKDSDEILRGLLTSLRVPIPNSRSLPTWPSQHLYPYVGELVHFDAVRARGSRWPRTGPRQKGENPISIEQYTYRGAGGLAHKILRTDLDHERLEANRAGLRALVEDSGGPLGKLANACAAHDLAAPKTVKDERESEAEVLPSRWVEVLRNGVANVTARRKISRSKRVDMLMHFVPFCVARHQLDLACEILDEPPFVFPAALVTGPSRLRQHSRHEVDRARGIINRALPEVLRRILKQARPGRGGGTCVVRREEPNVAE